jgi:hypothetical protein
MYRPYLVHNLLLSCGICEKTLHQLALTFGVLKLDPGLLQIQQFLDGIRVNGSILQVTSRSANLFEIRGQNFEVIMHYFLI